MQNPCSRGGGGDVIGAGLSRADIELILPSPHQMSNLEPLDDVRPSMPAPIFRAHEGGVEVATGPKASHSAVSQCPAKEFRKRLIL